MSDTVPKPQDAVACTLHDAECQGGTDDITKMQQVLATMQPHPDMTSDLHDAIRKNHELCVAFLIESGAEIDIRDNTENKSPLETAIDSNLEQMVGLLLNKDASPNYQWGSRTKYLELAIDKNAINIVKLLIKFGAIIDDYYINEQGIKRLLINYESPLINALWEENTEIFKLLLFNGAELECYLNDKNSIPHVIIASYLSALQTLDVFNIYKQYGGNLWSLQPDLEDRTDLPETALQSLRRQPFAYRFLGGPLDIDVHLELLMGQPLSLQSICRIKIKNTLGAKFAKKVPQLPLPQPILEFLLFQDV